jgi:alpha 1,3-glucosidase
LTFLGLAIYEDGSREEKISLDVINGAVDRDDIDGDAFWEESFGGHRDSKPLGPAAVGMSISFPGSKHLYGLPEHASSMKLQTTTDKNAYYSDPYRM